MPIYEYRCVACRKRTSLFVRKLPAPDSAICEHCAATNASRVFSRVAVHRGDDAGLDSAERGLGDIDENDPRSVARWVRKMSRDMGEPLDSDMQSELDRMESGEMPGGGDFGDDGGDLD